MVFPKSNLATASQPWGRYVETSIKTLQTTTATEKVNNAARDAQAALGIKRLDASLSAVAAATIAAQNAADLAQTSADAAQDAIDAITSLGSIDSDYTINAGNINAGTLTGITLVGNTIKTAASGTRLELYGTTMDAYYNTSLVGRISATAAYGGEISIKAANNNNGLYVKDDQTWLIGSTGNINIDTSDLTISSSSQIDLVSSTVRALGNLTTTGTFVAASTITTNSNAYVNGLLYNYGITSVSSTSNVRLGADFRFYTISSSRRYKADIQDVEYGLKALQLRPRTWVDKTAYEENGNSTEGLTRVPGFIAEELDEIGLGELVEYKNGIPESISYDRMVGALIPVIQHQQSVIESLTSRLEALENN